VFGIQPLLGEGIVPEEIGGEIPGVRLGNLEEEVADHGARDLDVVEEEALLDPVHGIDQVGGLDAFLVAEFEEVRVAEGDVVYE